MLIYTIFSLCDVAEAVKSLEQLIKDNKSQEAYTLVQNSLTDYPNDPKLIFQRAVIYEQLRQFQNSITDYAFVVSAPSPYKFKAIMKLKTMCVDVCQFQCEDKFSVQILGKEAFANLQNLTKWKNEAILSGNTTDLFLIAEKCTKDPNLYIRIVKTQLENNEFNQAFKTLEKLQEISSENSDTINELKDLYQILGGLATFVFRPIEESRFSNEEFFQGLNTYLTRMQIVHEVISKHSPISHKASDEAYNEALLALDAEYNVVIDQIETYAKTVIAKSFNSDISLSKLKLELGEYHTLSKNLINTILGNQIIPFNTTSKTPTLQALQAVTNYLLMEPAIDELAPSSTDQVELELKVEQLEYDIEANRKMLNRAKFYRQDTELQNIVWLLDDCNSLFDKIFLLRKRAMQPDFFKLLKVNPQSSTAEIKKSYYNIAKQLHPDNYEENITNQEKKRRQRLFQMIAEGYDVLTNQQKRAEFMSGQHNAGEISQRHSIHKTRKQASYDMHPDYKGGNGTVSDEEIKKQLTEEQWYEYQKQRRQGK
ncbi:Chaperone_protein DnaJ [Hexamita inflata]|uniref:Chaperone protein DnaJ n=1 Tax=Hexamita inflata TaxID=28002 RepID=A0AA86NBS3_9EUKA|nr:Chaperone protein DnaJ [Hexamita inflata]